ncbi:PQQ-binding-like beta-propeller repeat protein [Streptomyces sp. B1I3]|uniref:outer membrane protein assembly factor BamB family protein n=1 Tax=Streptomyces sp. B1I3 TaxID=3042264 RepID=UPI00277FBE00|nr:PQQ-binding-like beta-propeller repeat protein [Streptomyces sp. B1I3]MDQ0794007.1 outer membrane protein assembly factor BamB [Streptomyces sp. B1I3]
MEALRQDDPRHFGPYTVLARFRETASAVQYLVRDADGEDIAVVSSARPSLAAVPAFRRRFRSEAGTAERLSGGWVQPPLAAAEADGELWTAAAYVPALTLAEAIDLAGPLPERAVRILGAGLAETLSRVHATGAVLQGLAPGTVLLAGDGPRLTAFGPLGAAARAEARAGGQLSVRLGYLTPEQVEGKEAGPASDLFVLGLLLAYAATGTTPLADGPLDEAAERIAHASAELDSVPAELRDLIARCLAKDPADRPGAGSVAAELALEGAAGLAKGDWLPRVLADALADQAARVRALPVPEEARDVLRARDEAQGQDAPVAQSDSAGADAGEDSRTTRFLAPGARAPQTDRATAHLALPREPAGAPHLPALPQPAPHQLSQAPAPALPAARPHSYAYPAAASPALLPGPVPPAAPAPSATGRRALLTTVAAGVAGMLVGGGAVLALGSGDSAPAADSDDKPAPKPRTTLAGRAPEPQWTYAHPADAPAPLSAGLWQDELLLLTSTAGATAVDLRTGRKVWAQADAAGAQEVRAGGKGLCFLAGPTGFLWLSSEDGRIAHRVRYADQFAGVPGLKVAALTGSSGPVVWFTGSHTVTVKAPKPKKGKKPGKDTQVVKAYFFAYDVVARKELWRVPVPVGRAPGTPAYRLTAVRDADIVVAQDAATLTPADVKAAKGKASFRCFDRATGKQLWNRQFGALTPAGAALGDDEGRLYGAVGDDLQAFETATGKPVWTVNGTEGSVFGTPVQAGTLLHTTNRNQEVGAVERATGRVLWRRSTEVPLGGAAPALTLSGGGKTLLAADTSQVTAFAAADGRRMWKFQDIGVQDPKGATVGGPYRVLATGKTAVVQRERAVYAFPVD